MSAPVSFGRWLKELRRARDLTQDELARRVGCALITIKKIESDERRPSRQIAERMLLILAIPADEQPAFLRLARPTPPLGSRPQPPPPAALLVRDLDTLPGQAVKGYEIRECLGRGGFGAVFRALQPGVAREVAIKVILPQLADLPDFIRRFEAEAQTIARLEHPHIVPLYDYWREPGGAYLVMRYLRGGTLHALIQRGPLALTLAARLLEQVGAALSAAHRQGVVHRDLKPANILLDADANFYLADFGIAKDLGDAELSDLTQVGAVIGSPTYLSPEQIRAEPVTLRTDIYSLGIVLYEALAGAKPFQGTAPAELIQQHLSTPLPSPRLRRPDLPAALEPILQRATAKRPAERYADVASMVSDLLAALAAPPQAPAQPVSMAQAPALSSAPPTIELELLDRDNPYKGLRAFGEADAPDFFGRAALVAQLLERLAEPVGRQQGSGLEAAPDPRFLAVVGPSGAGKSSVVKAGLIPALRRGALPGSEHWFIADLIPGAHPFDELELALLRVASTQPVSLREQIDRDARGLLRAARLVLPDDDESELLVVVDQFEELFTLVADERTRSHFLNSLVAAVSDPRSRVRVIVTLRADYYDRPLRYGALGELMRANTEVVLPLDHSELEQAISGPATRVGLVLDPGLVATIINAVGEQPGALPLLQYALTELFERRNGRTLTLAAYEAIGGVAGALARRADALYQGLDEPGQQAARQIFLRLVTLGEGAGDTRRRVRLAELAAENQAPSTKNHPPQVGAWCSVLGSLDAVLDAYTQARLLTFDRDPLTRAPTVEVAHEALIRAWGRLRAWLDESRDDLRVQRRLAAAASEWALSGRDASFLADGARLTQFETLAAAADLALNEEETSYLRASMDKRDRLALEERERQARELDLQRRATHRLRYLVIALVVFLIAATGLSAFAFNWQAAADRNAKLAENNLTRSEAQRLAAEANALVQANGLVEVIGLLSVRSLRTLYTPQGDAAVAAAVNLDYPRQQLNHPQLVTKVAFSPDGRYVVTGSSDAIARLWDAQTGQEVREFVGHSDLVDGVDFSPDGNTVITSSFDGTARLWDARTGKELRRFSGHAGSVDSVAFTPDGAHIVTADADKTARLWDVATGQELCRFVGHTATIWVLAVSRDGTQLLTGSLDKTARLWDIRSGRELHTFTGHTDVVEGVAFAPDGKHILTGSIDKTARLWDVQTGAVVREFNGHSDGVRNVAFSPDGNSIVTGSNDATVRIWDVQTGQELRRFIGHRSDIFSVAFSPDGNTVASGSLDTTAQLWDVHGRSEYPQLNGHHASVFAAFSPDGNTIFTGSQDTTARLWDARSGAQQWVITSTEAFNTVVFSPDGRYIATGSMDQTARLWDAHTGTELRQFVGHRAHLNSVAFSPNGKYLLTGSGDREARLWDVATGQELRQLVGHTFDNVFSVAFSPDSAHALTGSYDGTARLWDVATGQELRRFNIPNDGAAAVAFSPDGKYVLTGSWDGVARLWDAQSGDLVRQFVGHTDIIWWVAFSPDGKYLLTGSQDKTARLWDVVTGQELRRFIGHTGTVNTVVFSPDGKRVLTGSVDGTARLWDADYHDTIAYICSRLLRDFSADERAQYSISSNGSTCNE
ncbi:MAG: protein kinase [Chloroflexi bacterium SZAS-1]|nr:protein kinase [Chloroflexi bacterium SZAS-1]